jgi:sugar phosphate isomerase/epimerase
MIPRTYFTAVLTFSSYFLAGQAAPAQSTTPAAVWARSNLHAWSVAPFDEVKRTPDERAQMLQRLGIRKYAYSWRQQHIATFDAEIEAMKRHGIEIIAWNFLAVEPGDPPAEAALEAFRRHGIKPAIWVMQSPHGRPRTMQDWQKYVSPGLTLPATPEDLRKLPEAERAKIQAELRRARLRARYESFTRTPREQYERVRTEADRIKRIVEAVAPYGCKVALYAHNSWFGIMDNQVAIIERLKELGVTDVGIVYNFHHARDEDHDDTLEFPRIWRKIKPYVTAITVTGVRFEGEFAYPSQGDAELEMMRVIQESGWHGSVGMTAEVGGDSEATLRNYQIGIEWIAKELARPGSGGPRPFPPLPPFQPQH